MKKFLDKAQFQRNNKRTDAQKRRILNQVMQFILFLHGLHPILYGKEARS